MKDNIVLMSKKDWSEINVNSDFEDIHQNAIRSKFRFLLRENKDIEITGENIREELYCRINLYLLENGITEESLFRCCIYISKIAEKFDFLGVEDSHLISNYLDSFAYEKRSVSIKLVKRNANNFFISCAVFPDIMIRDELSAEQYIEMGETIFWELYRRTESIIYFFMCSNFDFLIGITRECLANLYVRFPDEMEIR